MNPVVPESLTRSGYAIDVFQNGATTISVGSVADCTGLSARRFIEVFRREVGISPKGFSRLSRFRAVVSAVESTRPVDWVSTALACGYFDQAHLIHEFREFAGMSPSDYLRHRTASPNHVRVPG